MFGKKEEEKKVEVKKPKLEKKVEKKKVKLVKKEEKPKSNEEIFRDKKANGEAIVIDGVKFYIERIMGSRVILERRGYN